jgi:hypothetical protein
LAIGWMSRSEGLRREDLFQEDFVCIVRPGHPRIGRRLTLSQYTSEWHLVVGRHNPESDIFFSSSEGNLERSLTPNQNRLLEDLAVPRGDRMILRPNSRSCRTASVRSGIAGGLAGQVRGGAPRRVETAACRLGPPPAVRQFVIGPPHSRQARFQLIFRPKAVVVLIQRPVAQ